MKEMRCKDCQKFCQHYGLFEGEFKYVCCGHCMASRVRRRDPDQEACEQFIPKTQDSNGVVDKKYLSKKLLDYVLSLKLMPEIQEAAKEQDLQRGIPEKNGSG